MLKLKKVTKDATWQGLLSYKDQIKKLKDPADVENAVLNGLCYSTSVLIYSLLRAVMPSRFNYS